MTQSSWTRYLRLLGSLARYTLAREMAFRGNFLVKISVEVIWLGIMLAFYETIFARTNSVAGWPKNEYLFFVGCFFALNGLIECLFLENCNEFAELVRTGDLDFLLVRPIDEQFLVSCRRVDWATAPNVLMGFGRDGDRAEPGWAGRSTGSGSRRSSSPSPAGRPSATASC